MAGSSTPQLAWRLWLAVAGLASCLCLLEPLTVSARNVSMATMDPLDRPLSVLPKPLQQSHRLLVVINVHQRTRPRLTLRQLHDYVQVCEHGFEVHVVLTTTVSWHDTGIFNAGAYHCVRMLSDLPVVMVQFTPDIHRQLSGQHRTLFSKYMDDYDFFLYQEDDIAIKLQNIQYLTKYMHKLRGTRFIPGLQLFEVPVRDYTTSHVMVHPPYMHLMSLIFPMSLTRHGHDMLASVSNAYACGYMLPQHVLRDLVAQQDWLGDLEREPSYFNDMINEHYTGWFLGAKGYHVVFPVAGFKDSLAHHAPNKYLYLEKKPDRFMYNRNYDTSLIAVAELANVFAAGLGMPLPGFEADMDPSMQQKVLFSRPMQQCFPMGLHAVLSANVSLDRKATYQIDVHCSQDLAGQSKTQFVV